MRSWHKGNWEIRLWSWNNLAWGLIRGGNLWQADLGCLQIRKFFEEIE